MKFSSAVKQNITRIRNLVTSNNIRRGKSIKTSIPVNYIVTNRGKARKIPRTTPFIVEHFREKCRTDFSRRVVALHHCSSYFGKRLLQAIQFLVNDISRSGDFRNRLGGTDWWGDRWKSAKERNWHERRISPEKAGGYRSVKRIEEGAKECNQICRN